ncbi:MAG: OmpA family protein [Bacteroidia bacterium]
MTVDVQKENCIRDATKCEISILNHSSDSIESLELEIHGFSYSLLLPNLLDLDTSLRFEQGGIFQLYFNKKALKYGNRKSDSSTFFKLEDGCQYTLNILDSSHFWYIGKSFYLPIYFELGSSDIQPIAFPILEDLIETLVDNPNISIEMGVHTDERMPKEFSRCITCSRADAIVAYLVEKGIAIERLTAKGYQGNKPFLKGARTEEEHQQNRRVVITVTAIHE